MKVKLVSSTQIDQTYLTHLMKESGDKAFINNVQKPEGLAIYCARVSSPNQCSAQYERLLRYCARNAHWSVFEMIDATFEIETSRAIAQQILRHKSFSFQEFSQRYAKAHGFEIYEARRQDEKNRQNSLDNMTEEVKTWFKNLQDEHNKQSERYYNLALGAGVAKEQARFLLPLSVRTRLFMKGSLRSWIHYLQVRCDKSTQKEHRAIANEVKLQLSKQYPVIAEAMNWNEELLTL